jgi:hypothetical protein
VTAAVDLGVDPDEISFTAVSYTVTITASNLPKIT